MKAKVISANKLFELRLENGEVHTSKKNEKREPFIKRILNTLPDTEVFEVADITAANFSKHTVEKLKKARAKETGLLAVILDEAIKLKEDAADTDDLMGDTPTVEATEAPPADTPTVEAAEAPPAEVLKPTIDATAESAGEVPATLAVDFTGFKNKAKASAKKIIDDATALAETKKAEIKKIVDDAKAAAKKILDDAAAQYGSVKAEEQKQKIANAAKIKLEKAAKSEARTKTIAENKAKKEAEAKAKAEAKAAIVKPTLEQVTAMAEAAKVNVGHSITFKAHRTEEVTTGVINGVWVDKRVPMALYRIHEVNGDVVRIHNKVVDAPGLEIGALIPNPKADAAAKAKLIKSEAAAAKKELNEAIKKAKDEAKAKLDAKLAEINKGK